MQSRWNPIRLYKDSGCAGIDSQLLKPGRCASRLAMVSVESKPKSPVDGTAEESHDQYLRVSSRQKGIVTNPIMTMIYQMTWNSKPGLTSRPVLPN
jgi:hypothetical protein